MRDRYHIANILALLLALALTLGMTQPVRADGKTQIVMDYSSPIFDIIRDSQAKLGMQFNANNYAQVAQGSYWNPRNWVNTHTVCTVPPCNYGVYRAAERAMGEWAETQGGERYGGWNWRGVNGYVAFFAQKAKAAVPALWGTMVQTQMLYKPYGGMYGTYGDVNN